MKRIDSKDSPMSRPRKDKQHDIVKRIVRIATLVMPETDGVEISFINSRKQHSRVREQDVDAITGRLSLMSGSQLGTQLEAKILRPLVYDNVTRGKLRRPVLVSIITDGEPNHEDDDTFEQVLLGCVKKLKDAGYPPKSKSCLPVSRSALTAVV